MQPTDASYGVDCGISAFKPLSICEFLVCSSGLPTDRQVTSLPQDQMMKPLLLILSMVTTFVIVGCRTEIERAVASGDADALLIALGKNGEDYEKDKNGNVISISVYLSPAEAQVTDEVLAIFGGFTHLKDLNLGRATISDAGLEYLRDLHSLETLTILGDYMDGTKITDQGLKPLGGLHRLKSLHIESNKITDKGLAHLKGLTELEALSFPSSQITGTGISELLGMKKLSVLHLYDSKFSDAGVKHLAKLENLVFLSLRDTRVSGIGFDCLANLTQLVSIDLGNNEISGAGIADLKKLTNLGSLDLTFTQLTPSDIIELKTALPDCRIKSEHKIP